MAIEIVDLPSKNGDFPYLCGCLPEGKSKKRNASDRPLSGQNKALISRAARV